MSIQPSVRVTLTSQIAPCPNRHAVGDTWDVGSTSPPGLCLGALNALLPAISALRFGGNFPWMTEPGVGVFCCPDAAVQNVFKVERIKEDPQTGPAEPT